MKAVEKRTVIRINGTVLALLKEAYECLEQLTSDLGELSEEDADCNCMYDLSSCAEAYISDLLDAYKDYIREGN